MLQRKLSASQNFTMITIPTDSKHKTRAQSLVGSLNVDSSSLLPVSVTAQPSRRSGKNPT
jgi:hypothetical protein